MTEEELPRRRPEVLLRTYYLSRSTSEEGEMVRASGDCLCPRCGYEYRHHPHSRHRDWQGEPFLHLLCEGLLVKL